MRPFRIHIMVLLFALFAPAGLAQKASTMKFAGDEWDFGRIREVDGTVEHTFSFTNSGSTAFVIEKVTVGCGCTTPVFSRHPVLPGRKGEITIRYDPEDRPGTFVHDIEIVGRKGRNRNTLRIRGEVVPRPRSVEDDYPFLYPGGIRFSVLSLNFGMVEQGKARSMTIGYANTSDRAVALEFDTPPERGFLSVSAPRTVAPGERGDITVTYDLTKTTFYGRQTDRIIPVIDGKRDLLVFSAIFTAVDSREGVVPEEGPEIVISPMFHHFGNARRTDRPSREIRLTNEGRRPLVVRWVDPKPFISAGLKAGTTVEPGGSVEFTAVLDLSGLDRGLNTGSISVISNDPLRPVREIRFAVNVR